MKNRYGRWTFPIFHAPDGAGGSDPTGGETGSEGNHAPENSPTPEPPMTFDQLLGSNKDYQAEHDRKVSQAIETARKKWEQQHRDDMTEAEKLATMTDTQRKEYQLKKDRAALDAERATFQRQQLQVSVAAELQKRGISADFAGMLTGKDADTSRANIDAFEAHWNASVQDAVNGRMRANPPKDPAPNGALSLEDIRSMSREEINKNWEQISASLEKKGR